MNWPSLIPDSPLGIFLAGSVLVLIGCVLMGAVAGWMERRRIDRQLDDDDPSGWGV